MKRVPWLFKIVSASAALSGTAVPTVTEPEVVAGAKTIVITIAGDTVIPN